MARQLTVNAETKQRWMEANPIEIRHQQQGYHANIKVGATSLEDL